MTDTAVEPEAEKTGNGKQPGSWIKPKENGRKPFDPDRFLMMAKAIVVQNYNEHRRPEQGELTMNRVYIVSFSKVLGNWRALVASPFTRGMMWEVTFNGHKNEAYLDFYKKITNVVIHLGDPE